MFTKLSVSVVVALAAVAQAASPGYGGYGGYGPKSYKHSHASKPHHNSTSIPGSPASTVPVSASEIAGTGATSLPNLSTGVATTPILSSSVVVPTVPLSTGVSSSEIVPISASTGSASAPYPISETPGVSSTVGNSPIGTGVSSVPQGPIGTGTGSGSGITSAPGPFETKTSDTTLTYTLGSGSSTTVVTTTIKHTSTETNVEVRNIALFSLWLIANRRQTVYATESASTGEATGGSGAGEPTTTISHTSTFTKVITVQPISSPTGVQQGNSPIGGSGAGGAGGSCKPQVTVTVTGPAQTVTVVGSLREDDMYIRLIDFRLLALKEQALLEIHQLRQPSHPSVAPPHSEMVPILIYPRRPRQSALQLASSPSHQPASQLSQQAATCASRG